MKNFYFTFSTRHWTTDGVKMGDYWVTVIADNYAKARQLFIDKFSSQRMEREDKFLKQLTDENFDPNFFPGGEYERINQRQI